MKRIKICLLVTLLATRFPGLHATPPGRSIVLYVSTIGKDTHPGTSDKPFATLEKARLAVQQLRTNDSLLQVEVIIRAGVYHLDKTLEFGPSDSGSRQAPVIWRAAQGEKVVLSGGKPIRGTWRKEPGGLWSVAVPEARGWTPNNSRPETYDPNPSGPWNFRQLFINGRRAVRARYPNVTAGQPFFFAVSGAQDHLRLPPGTVRPAWGKETDAQINIIPRWRFFNQWNDVSGIDSINDRIFIGPRERHGEIDAGTWGWIEGVKSELDSPGEWYLDHAEGRLYYKPRPGEDPQRLEVIAPRLSRIISLQGNIDSGTYVRNIHFRGFTFRHTRYTLGQIEARVHTDGAVFLENAQDCVIEDSRFELIGGYACWMHLDAQRNQFRRNNVTESGGGGVLMTGARLSYMDETKIYTPGEKARNVFPIRNEIIGNTVEHCGRIRYYGGGVHIDSRPASMAMSPGNHIAHNLFRDLSRNGIFAFRNQGGHVIEFNEIHDCMQTTIDGAAIHLATMNRLAAPNFILDNLLYNVWGFEQLPGTAPRRTLANGVFLDWATSNTTLRHNVIYNTGEREIKPIMGNWNLEISDNLVSPTPIPARLPGQTGPAGNAAHFIYAEDLRLPGAVILSDDTSSVRFTGPWQKKQINGMRSLFKYVCRSAAPGSPASAVYTIPVPETGWYRLCLNYFPDNTAASNARLNISHARGSEQRTWNFKKGDPLGFSVLVGTYYFEKGEPARITIDNEGADGQIIADGVGIIKTENQ